MNDYISREAAIRAHCDGCVDDGYCGKLDGGYACEDVPNIMAIPAADVVEVVRCKDCKHRPISTIEGEDYGFSLEPPDDDWRCPCLNGEDGWYSWMPEDDFYCADGERSTEKGAIIDE